MPVSFPIRGRPMSPALARYQRRLWPTLAVYALVLVGVIRLFKTAPPAGGLKQLAALAPAVPVVAIIVYLGLYLVEETDEFRRLKVVQSMLCGLGVALAFTTSWGFLETLAGAPHIPMFWVFPIYCLGMGLSQPFIAWRYR